MRCKIGKVGNEFNLTAKKVEANKDLLKMKLLDKNVCGNKI